MSSITPLHEKLSAVATANGDAFKAIVEIALNTSEQLFALNLNVIRSSTASVAVPKDGNVSEQMTAQFGSPARSLELTSDYLRNVSGILLKSQSEIGQINVARTNELAQSISTLLDSMAKSGPAGSAEVVEQIKSALSSATEAYENMVKTSGEMAERTVAAAGEAVQPMIAAASSTEKKVTKKAA